MCTHFKRIVWFPEISTPTPRKVGGAVTSWLVCSILEWVVRVWALVRDIVLCSWARHFTLTELLSSQVYKWVPVNLMLGGNPAMDNHPIQGGVEILLVTSCYKNQDKLQPDGQQLACMQTLPLPQGGLLELLRGKGSQKLKYFKENMNQNWIIKRDGERGNWDKNPIYGKSINIFWKNIFSILQKHFLMTN